MHVFVSNESDATLNFGHDEIAHGDYTPDWSPPRVIKPGQRVGFQGEGDLAIEPTTGTEGRVWYNIAAPEGSGGELYIHWDSPLIESQYGNTFHIWAPAGWEVTHSGGQGHDAEVDIRLRRTARRSVPNFHANGRDSPLRTIGTVICPSSRSDFCGTSCLIRCPAHWANSASAVW
jgi:hypothetical protein